MARYQRTKGESRMIKEWLAAGNKIEVCPPGARTEQEDIVHTWGNRKKKATPAKKPAKKV